MPGPKSKSKSKNNAAKPEAAKAEPEVVEVAAEAVPEVTKEVEAAAVVEVAKDEAVVENGGHADKVEAVENGTKEAEKPGPKELPTTVIV